MMRIASRRLVLTLSFGLAAFAPWDLAFGQAVAEAPGAVASSVEPAALDVAAFQAGLERIRNERKLPAIGGLLFDASGVRWQGVTGTRQQTADAPVTLDDRWHLGSCTKAMTAVMIARLVDRGTLRFESTVGELLPALRAEMKEGWPEVTLAQLLSHTAGIAREPITDPELWPKLRADDAAGRSTREQRGDVARWLVAHAPGFAPGTKMVYSNAGYMLAGYIAEVATDRSWEDLMHAEVFGPLGITSAGFGPPGSLDEVDQPRGHVGWGGEGHKGSWVPIVSGPAADNPRALGPAGTVHMTMADWAKFLAVFIEPGVHADAGDDAPFLTSASRQRLTSIMPGTWDASTLAGEPGALPDEGYALGWGVTWRPWAKGHDAASRGIVLTHNGTNKLWYAVCWLAPERRLGALAVTNVGPSEGAPATDEVVSMLIRAATVPAR